MDNYCVGKTAAENGMHIVHICSCLYRPDLEEQDHLGPFATCEEAMKKARTLYKKVNGCIHCCKPCHTD